MNKNRTIISAICWVVLLSTFSCTEEVKPKPFEYSKLFTGANSKTWAITRAVIREKGKESELTLTSCEKDDRYIFYANEEKLFEVSNGVTKCDEEEDALLVSYVWGFSNANASLTMVIPHIFGNFIIPFIVKKADDDEMELEVYADLENTVSYGVYFQVVGQN